MKKEITNITKFEGQLFMHAKLQASTLVSSNGRVSSTFETISVNLIMRGKWHVLGQVNNHIDSSQLICNGCYCKIKKGM